MRQDERDNEHYRDGHRRRFSGDEFDRAWDGDPHSTAEAADGAYGETGRFRAEARAREQPRSRRDLGHDDGWGDNREGYDNAGRFGVRGSDHEGRRGFTQDRSENDLGGYSQNWAEFGFQGDGWRGNPRDEPRYRTDDYSPWGGESWPGYQIREGADGSLASGWAQERGARGPHAGRGPKGYRRKDERITEDVCEALTSHPDIDASEIEVRVENGEVTLTGSVDSREAKRAAEDAAEECAGVDNVINQLRVQRGAQAEDHPRSSQGWRQRMTSHAASNKDDAGRNSGGDSNRGGQGGQGGSSGGNQGGGSGGNRGGSNGGSGGSQGGGNRGGSGGDSGGSRSGGDSSRGDRDDR